VAASALPPPSQRKVQAAALPAFTLNSDCPNWTKVHDLPGGKELNKMSELFENRETGSRQDLEASGLLSITIHRCCLRFGPRHSVVVTFTANGYKKSIDGRENFIFIITRRKRLR
jgi:hypothetical protein